MSKLNLLITDLCPNGVSYKKLADVAIVNRGVRVVRKQLDETGKNPVFQNSLTPLGYINSSNCPANTPFVISAGAAGDIGYSNVDFWAADDCLYIIGKNIITNRFIYHVLLQNQPMLYSRVRKASVPRLSRSVVENMKVPVPPLEVQREIVRILDNFTELTAEITAKLTAELTARRKQYEYYRDALLSSGYENAAWLTIEKCTEKTENIKWKLVNDKFQYIDLSSVNRDTSSITQTTTIDSSNAPSRAQQIVHSEDILFGTTRPMLKRYCIVPKEYNNQIASTGFCVLRAKKNIVRPKWIYYWLSSDEFYNYIKPLQVEGSYPSVTNNSVKSFQIPVPPFDEQDEIISILDNLEKLCNDISEALPAEIEARQKQYEYYRDKLLSFPER